MLYLKTHNFHWNVTGPMFQTLHIMFMEQYTELWNALDNIAERIRALGAFRAGHLCPLRGTVVDQGRSRRADAQEMIRQLVDGQEALIRTVREAFKIADDANDQPSAGMLSDRMEIHEKNAWMLRPSSKTARAPDPPARPCRASRWRGGSGTTSGQPPFLPANAAAAASPRSMSPPVAAASSLIVADRGLTLGGADPVQ